MAFKLGQADSAGRPSAVTTKTQASLSTIASNPTLVMVGKLGNRNTRMLVDTGSAQSSMDHLTQPARPIVAANGEKLDLIGGTELRLCIGDLDVPLSVFIAKELTHECLLGADFLKQHNCVINMRERTLYNGRRKTSSVPNQRSSGTYVCVPCFSFSRCCNPRTLPVAFTSFPLPAN